MSQKLNFKISTKDGLLDRRETFNNMNEFEEKMGPYSDRSIDGIIKIEPEDESTKMAAEIRAHQNKDLFAAAENSPLRGSKDPMLMGTPKKEVTDLIKGQLETYGFAKKGNTFWVKGNMLDQAAKLLTGQEKGGLITSCREGIDFIYDQVSDIGVVIDRQKKARGIGELEDRPMVPTIPLVMEYGFEGVDTPALRINHGADSRASTHSNVQHFSQFYVKEGRMAAENKTIDHPDFQYTGLENEFQELINKRDLSREREDEPELNIEKPSLRPS